MKLEIKNRENYCSLYFSQKIPFIERTLKLSCLFYRTPETWVHGYSSRTKNGRYVLFHDYDSLEIEDVIEELRWLQQKFKLSTYYIFKLDRENSYHAVCIDTFSLAEAYDIQKTTSCDLAFIYSIKKLQTKEWILRWGKKGDRDAPIYLGRVKSHYNKRIKSTAHAEFLRKLDVPISGIGKWDGIQELGFVDYNTANRTIENNK